MLEAWVPLSADILKKREIGPGGHPLMSPQLGDLLQICVSEAKATDNITMTMVLSNNATVAVTAFFKSAKPPKTSWSSCLERLKNASPPPPSHRSEMTVPSK